MLDSLCTSGTLRGILLVFSGNSRVSDDRRCRGEDVFGGFRQKVLLGENHIKDGGLWGNSKLRTLRQWIMFSYLQHEIAARNCGMKLRHEIAASFRYSHQTSWNPATFVSVVASAFGCSFTAFCSQRPLQSVSFVVSLLQGSYIVFTAKTHNTGVAPILSTQVEILILCFPATLGVLSNGRFQRRKDVPPQKSVPKETDGGAGTVKLAELHLQTCEYETTAGGMRVWK